MDNTILVVEPDQEKRDELCAMLQRYHYYSDGLHSLEDLQEKLQEAVCQLVILDLDTLPVDNRFFRNIRRQYPTMWILGLSSRPFHPELKEAMSQHIYSCLSKPVDEEELVFWIKSLFQNQGSS